MTTDKTKKIAELNDLFRWEGAREIDRKVLTQGIYDLPIMEQYAIMCMVGEFEEFTPDNDPYGERNFGAFEYAGHKIFWKIDYYNLALDGASADPSDEAQTVRVLTTMLASEY